MTGIARSWLDIINLPADQIVSFAVFCLFLGVKAQHLEDTLFILIVRRYDTYRI